MHLRVIGGFHGNVVERMSMCFTRDGLVPYPFGFPLINSERLLGTRGSHRVALYARNSFFSRRKDFVRTDRGLSFKLIKSCTLLLQTQLLEGLPALGFARAAAAEPSLSSQAQMFLVQRKHGEKCGASLKQTSASRTRNRLHALISAKHGSARILVCH